MRFALAVLLTSCSAGTAVSGGSSAEDVTDLARMDSLVVDSAVVVTDGSPVGSDACAGAECDVPCVPDCLGRACGSDGCGGQCGTCAPGAECAGGVCKAPECVGDDCCEPKCDGKTCGDDGCEGSCGACSGGQFCDGATGQCGLVLCTPSGEPRELECGDIVSGVSDGAGSTSTHLTSGCSEGDYSAPEQVYRFVATEAGVVRFDVPSFDGDEDLDVFVVEDDAGTCDAQNCVNWGFTGAQVDVVPGTRYWVVIDGYEGNVSWYDLSVTCCTPVCDGRICGPDGCGGSCGTCPSGKACVSAGTVCSAVAPSGNDTCATATEVLSLPFEAALDTTPLTDDYSLDGQTGCAANDVGGRDAVFRFVPPSTGTVTIGLDLPEPGSPDCIEISPGASCGPTILQVTTACADTADECLASNDYYATPGKQLSVPVTAGKVLFVTVDGFDSVEAGIAVLRIE